MKGGQRAICLSLTLPESSRCSESPVVREDSTLTTPMSYSKCPYHLSLLQRAYSGEDRPALGDHGSEMFKKTTVRHHGATWSFPKRANNHRNKHPVRAGNRGAGHSKDRQTSDGPYLLFYERVDPL